MPANLPFQIELYRLVVALVVFIWITSLLIDRRVRLERTAFDKPLLLIVLWALASEVANPGRVESLSTYVAKSLTFFLSFVLVYYVTASVIRKRSEVILLLKVLVLGCGVIALSSLIEHRSGFNIFYHVHSVVPFLQFQGGGVIERFGRLRVLGSAQHPIALGAVLVVPIPLGVYFARTAGRRWWIVVAALLLGALATGSRTAIVMLIAMTVVYLFLKPQETRRIWPLLIPGVVIVHVVVPGAIGTLRNAFFPPGGIIAEQSQLGLREDPNLAGGRIRQLRPMLSEAAGYPIFGEGLGTRITGFNSTFRNAPILDNQWLNTILELGYVGAGVLALALRSQHQAPLPCVTGVGRRRRLAFCRTCRFDHGLRRRDADIRRVQFHADHVRLLDPARALRGDAADPRRDAGGSAGVRAATAAGPRGERLAQPCRGRADQRDAFRSSAPALRGVWRRSPSKSARIRESELLLETGSEIPARRWKSTFA